MTTNSLTQITVPFHSAELYLVEHNGQPYTPMKPIVEGMGLDWKSQYRKLTEGNGQNDHTPNRWGATKIVIPTLGDLQEMICIPLRKLFAWLSTIRVNKVNPEIRDSVIMYQNECDDVLWDYWTKGVAVNPRKSTPKDREGLRHAVSNLVSRAKINFSDAYNMVLQRFGRNHIEEIPLEELDNAVEYVHGLILTFDKSKHASTVDINAAQDCYGVLQYRLIEYHTGLENEVKRLGGKLPEYPSYNPEEVVQALMSRILQGKKMILNMNFQGGISLDLMPRDAILVDSRNISELVSRSDLVAKDQLPLIVQSAMDRLIK